MPTAPLTESNINMYLMFQLYHNFCVIIPLLVIVNLWTPTSREEFNVMRVAPESFMSESIV